MRKILSLFIILFSACPAVLNAEYVFSHFLENDVVNGISIENNYIWCATDSGVVRFDKTTGNSIRYTTDDGLSSNKVLCVAIDHNGVKWFGTFHKGVSWFDGAKWYSHQSFSWAIAPDITTMAVDSKNIKWFMGDWLTTYNDKQWIDISFAGGSDIAIDSQDRIWIATTNMNVGVYNPVDSTWQLVGEIEGWTFTAVTEDNNHVMWFGADQGVESFDGGKKVIYEMTDYFFPGFVRNIAVDKNNVKWFGTEESLWSFDGKTWKWYNTDKSFCPVIIYDVEIDGDGIIWTAGQFGLSSFRPDSATGVNESLFPMKFRISGIYPNPFNPSTTISFSLPSAASATLTVYDISGRIVRSLISGNRSSGNHSATWDGKDDAGRLVSSGVYIARLESGKSAQSMKMLLIR